MQERERGCLTILLQPELFHSGREGRVKHGRKGEGYGKIIKRS